VWSQLGRYFERTKSRGMWRPTESRSRLEKKERPYGGGGGKLELQIRGHPSDCERIQGRGETGERLRKSKKYPHERGGGGKYRLSRDGGGVLEKKKKKFKFGCTKVMVVDKSAHDSGSRLCGQGEPLKIALEGWPAFAQTRCTKGNGLRFCRPRGKQEHGTIEKRIRTQRARGSEGTVMRRKWQFLINT